MSAVPPGLIEPGAKVAFTDTLGFTSQGVLVGYTSRTSAEVRHRGDLLDGCISIVPVAWLRPCSPPTRPGAPSAPVERRVRKERKRA